MGKKAKLVERRSIMTKDNEQEVFEVQELLGKRVVRGKTQYKVRWSGYSEEWDTWENEENIHTIEMIRDFEKNFEKTQELTYFIPKHMYAVQTGRQVHSILGLDKDDRYGVIALVTYEKLQEEKVQAELVPTEVLADDEEASQILLNYYENYKLY